MSVVIKFSPNSFLNYTKFVTSFNTKCVSVISLASGPLTPPLQTPKVGTRYRARHKRQAPKPLQLKNLDTPLLVSD